MTENSVREKVFKLTRALEKPLDLLNHLPFRIAVISNLLAFNRDWKIRSMCNLEPRELRIFINIGSYMPIKAADIAYQSRLDSYTVSRAVKKLQSAQLIEIEADPTHKNIKNLMLSKQGKALYESLVPALEERSQVLENVLTKQERILFYSMLEKVENKAEQILAEQALAIIKQGGEPPADQKEIIRWYRKGQKK
ncbi:MAG: DNA-binding MarR family transcriptional regulator [Oceanospirillaceae bacterium]|jgi:DNA-binding MarR family transcriptional regulator